ncbi:hypothetical protein [Chelativorans sp. AA-79]|uniref:hypothetical protein n=1 Tax=Chelativorans sp. AA-79 TaxID=3028735 RepID=UPI0023F9D67F|nr:hypothetical protein [Chelativorans sp. AA-79]WEX11651.1 hypothetical protein PVE73_12355 [Chelativorans sp. AA-79]
MAEANSEFMYQFLKKMQDRFDKVDFALLELKSEVTNLRGAMVALQSDTPNLYMILARHDERLGRIERRLEPRELAETEKP